jgi:hypothetical protein
MILLHHAFENVSSYIAGISSYIAEMRMDYLAACPGVSISAVKFKEMMGFNGVEGKHTTAGRVFVGIKQK